MTDFSKYGESDLALMFNQPTSIQIIWSVDDVLSVAPDLQGFQARFILAQLKKCHDTSLGINWDVIKTTVQVYFPSARLNDEVQND
tara:strand:+ start:582 stop:839 length:258 start_codon:yes stop_codon:yes gene_type:complete